MTCVGIIHNETGNGLVPYALKASLSSLMSTVIHTPILMSNCPHAFMPDGSPWLTHFLHLLWRGESHNLTARHVWDV